MSVFTPVSRTQLERFLRLYDQGELIEYQGIAAGIENTNYFVTTRQGQFVLTLFEKLNADELPFFLKLMAHLADRGIPCAHPVADRYGHYLQRLTDKPAALVARLHGLSPQIPTVGQCAAVGEALAKLHLAALNYPGRRPNDRSHAWWEATARTVAPRLTLPERRLLKAELEYQRQNQLQNLPHSIIHGDLFRDNAMFEDDILTGIIDFYYACNGIPLYDVAVTINDWCSVPGGALDQTKACAVIGAYSAIRAFTPLETAAWPVLRRAAALRFWLSRLYDSHFPRTGEITHVKDPDVFKNILKFAIDKPFGLNKIIS